MTAPTPKAPPLPGGDHALAILVRVALLDVAVRAGDETSIRQCLADLLWTWRDRDAPQVDALC